MGEKRGGKYLTKFMYLDPQEKNKELLKAHRRVKFSYREFIESDYWRIQKEVWYSRHQKRCARCGSTKYINLHHKKYPKAFRYLSLSDNDFTALCRSCHSKYHKMNGVQQNMQTKTNTFVRRKKVGRYPIAS